MTEVAESIYGDAQGRWALVIAPLGLITPPYVDLGDPPGQVVRLTSIGSASDALTRIHNAHRGNKRPVQQALAELLGITQQQVSRIIVGIPVRLGPELVAKLVHAWFWPQEVQAAIERLTTPAAAIQAEAVANHG